MDAMRWFRLAASVALLIATVVPAWPLDTVDNEALRIYGGNYSSQCGNPTAARLRVDAQGKALMVEKGTKRITGRNVMAAYSYFGQSPPENFQLALMSEVRGGMSLIFLVYRDERGLYASLDGDPKVLAAIGKPLVGYTYRNCDATAGKEIRAESNVAAVPLEAEAPGGSILVEPGFKSAYYKALGPLVREDWLARLEGPSPPVRAHKFNGREYRLAAVCKDHDCYDFNTVLLYSSAQGRVYGKVYRQGRSTMIGSPSRALSVELERLWKAEWRKPQ